MNKFRLKIHVSKIQSRKLLKWKHIDLNLLNAEKTLEMFNFVRI